MNEPNWAAPPQPSVLSRVPKPPPIWQLTTIRTGRALYARTPELLHLLHLYLSKYSTIWRVGLVPPHLSSFHFANKNQIIHIYYYTFLLMLLHITSMELWNYTSKLAKSTDITHHTCFTWYRYTSIKFHDRIRVFFKLQSTTEHPASTPPLPPLLSSAPSTSSLKRHFMNRPHPFNHEDWVQLPPYRLLWSSIFHLPKFSRLLLQSFIDLSPLHRWESHHILCLMFTSHLERFQYMYTCIYRWQVINARNPITIYLW